MIYLRIGKLPAISSACFLLAGCLSSSPPFCPDVLELSFEVENETGVNGTIAVEVVQGSEKVVFESLHVSEVRDWQSFGPFTFRQGTYSYRLDSGWGGKEGTLEVDCAHGDLWILIDDTGLEAGQQLIDRKPIR